MLLPFRFILFGQASKCLFLCSCVFCFCGPRFLKELCFAGRCRAMHHVCVFVSIPAPWSFAYFSIALWFSISSTTGRAITLQICSRNSSYPEIRSWRANSNFLPHCSPNHFLLRCHLHCWRHMMRIFGAHQLGNDISLHKTERFPKKNFTGRCVYDTRFETLQFFDCSLKVGNVRDVVHPRVCAFKRLQND